MATSSPASARRPAHTSPAGPAPMTTTSKLRSLMAPSQSRCDRRYKAMASCADAPSGSRPRPRGAARGLRIGREHADGRHDDQRDRQHERRHRRLDPRRPHRPPTAPATTNDDPGPPPPAAGRTAAGRGVRLVKVGDFQAPVYLTSPPGDKRRLFIVEQAGRIVVVRGGRPLAQPFLDIRSKVTAGGEQGLLSVAFPPDYAQSGLFYVYYTEKSGTEAIWEYHRASEDRANPARARLVPRMDDPEPNHNGGLMLFGPDRLMYVGTGDGGGGNDQHGARGNAQSLSSLLGKILRIDPKQSGGKAYTIPSSNPFVGRAGARGEIYAYGLRNPWRFSFDSATGDLAIGDVGQDAVEEIDFVRKGGARGANFGWRPWEGRRRNFDEPAPHAIFPVITHTHQAGFCSITGGF